MTPFRVALIILVLVSSLYCQQSNCRFSVPVIVTDAKTFEPLQGFGTDSFQIQVGNKKLVPSEVAYGNIRRVFLFVDASGSMRSSKWAVVMQTAYELLTNISIKVPLTMEVFAEKSRSFANRDEAYTFLRFLGENGARVRPLGGRTELYDNIASVVDSEHIGIEDAVIIITDAGDNLSKMSDSKLTRELTDRAIHPAILLIQSESGPKTVEEQTGVTSIEQMAEQLGGLVLYLPERISQKPEQLLPLRLYAEALAYYRVSFETATPEKARLKVTILKKPEDGRKFEVLAPRRLPLCSVQR